MTKDPNKNVEAIKKMIALLWSKTKNKNSLIGLRIGDFRIVGEEDINEQEDK
jgi:hypothetical protein